MKKINLFQTETGNYMVNLALQVELIEKDLIKNEKMKKLMELYNTVYDFGNKIITEIEQIEQKEGVNK